MKAEDILQSRWLDILFENRNKEYGAYAIRKNYNQRLTSAVIAALLISITIFLFLNNLKQDSRAVALYAGTEYEIVELPQAKQPEKTPEVKPPQQPPPRKTIAYLVPVFTPDAVPQISSPDDNDDSDVAGTTNPNGDPGGTTTQPATPSTPDPGPPVTQPAPDPAPVVKDIPVTYAEEMPAYPGGRDKMIAFLQQQLQDYVTEEGQAKKATVRFVVEKDGTLTAVEIVTGSDGDFNKRVVRTIQKMPRWKPGAQNGQKVKVLYEFPIQLVPADE